MQLEVSPPVADGQVGACGFGLGRVKGRLEAGEPGVVPQHGGGVNHGAGEIEIHIAAQVHVLALVRRLHFPALLPVWKGEGRGLANAYGSQC